MHGSQWLLRLLFAASFKRLLLANLSFSRACRLTEHLEHIQ